MRLHIFTRKLAECRKRWNRGSLRYVLEAARILRTARLSAKSTRRWGRWIDEETSMSRTTVYRYLKVELLIKANVARLTLFENLGLNKIFTLARLEQTNVLRILRSGKLPKLSDIAFRSYVQRFKSNQQTLITTPNLIRALDAALRRLETAIGRWRSCRRPLPPEIKARMVSKLRRVIRETRQDARPAIRAI